MQPMEDTQLGTSWACTEPLSLVLLAAQREAEPGPAREGGIGGEALS